MGTIGDLLGGLDLSSLGMDSTDPTEDTLDLADQASASQHDADHTDSEDSPHAGGAATGAPQTADEIVMAAILEHTSLQPQDARADLRLKEDLDMDELQLYAVVATVERALHTSFPDETVHSWQTVGDILTAASSA